MGIELISEIVQKNNQKFPLVDSNNIRGGIYSVNTINERDNIPLERRKNGMLCYVSEEEEYYKLNNNTWETLTLGGVGIPIFDQELIDLNKDKLPEKYITIPNKQTDLSQETFSREIQNTGTYVDILFSAIRKLQSEIARIKNSFNYGIYSYTGKDTAMSRIVNGITAPDDEPLWAIEESDLSLVYSLTVGGGHELTPDTAVDISKEGILQISGEAFWEDTEEVVKSNEDVKLFCYLTVSNLNLVVNLVNEGYKTIDFKNFNLPKLETYNIMILISRSIDNINSSENYIYISIGNANRSQIIKEGFLKSNFTEIVPTKQDIGKPYYINKITLTDLNLSKLNFYSKYQDFSKKVIPSMPSDDTYKYSVAHITIRSVKTEEVLKEIKDQLPNNELIFVENTRKLWIKNNNKLVVITGGSGGSEESGGMTQTEVINLLKEMGIIKEDDQNLTINDISDITFVHQDTGRRYKFTVDSEGNLKSIKLPEKGESLEERITNSKVELKETVRGFIGQLRIAENNSDVGNVQIEATQDARIYADRVKIGAFYAPLNTDSVFGCNRAFVELENTADCDFNLTGCYLHFTHPNNIKEQVVDSLALTGTIPAGGTYLIVGKEYSDINDMSTQIKVNSFDQEWFIDKKLIDFTIDADINTQQREIGYGFALTYGNKQLTSKTYLYKKNAATSPEIPSGSKFPFIYDPSFIDAIYFYKGVKDDSDKGYWADSTVAIKSNTMYKNMFELDPAKQAFQSCNTSDSSRNRWKSANDVWVLDLSKPLISFPHSSAEYPISRFSPKASYEHKNVQTDKSKLDLEKPNMVNCSFGTNIYTDRCFNWISAGVYDEFVWLRKKDTQDSWTYAFESYRPVESSNSKPLTYPARKEYSKELNNAAYARIINRFPADNTQYTSHKCVVKLAENPPIQPETWEYIVGRRGKNGGPDLEHVSEVFTFTLYPESYTPRIYQTTDQQGFHWVEYQVWAAAANKIYEKIKEDKSSEQIIPIIINTGDMTQNGTRISEWYDYYTAGYPLFKEFEHMAVVGNNDLCNTDVNALGTGDDQGKSNSFYFHVFYCYDIDETIFTPIVNNKYIPSLYFFDSKDFRFVNVNSEITAVNCAQWFNLIQEDVITNIYTGFTIEPQPKYNSSFTSIYTMLFKMLTTDKQCIVSCHEMPFTVITNESIQNGSETKSRSISNAGALVGSHMNQLSTSDDSKGTYWFSRLLEKKGVRLVLGGHKHTYACTYPLREYFYFKGPGDGQEVYSKNSKDNYSDYQMQETLENDDIKWEHNSKNLTKFPLTKRADVGSATTGFFPYTPVPNLEGGVTYFMCQATGYKLTSNKELPSANQKFSLAVPNTINKGGKDSADDNQKHPMFGIIKLSTSQYIVKLVRVENIFNTTYKFAQNVFSEKPMVLKYFKSVPDNNYGTWVSEESDENNVTTINL